jgi:hypothetical protein
VYLTVATGDRDRPWFWTASDGNVDLGHGYAASKQEAADAATAAYVARLRQH